MEKGLTRRSFIKRTLKGLGFLAGTATLGGCTELYALMAKSKNEGISTIGEIGLTKDAHEKNLDVAQKGKTEVNIYNGQKRQADTYKKTRIFNNWSDRDGEGDVDDDEITGLKDIFRKNEGIKLFFECRPSWNTKGKTLTLRIFGPKNNLAYTDSIKTPWERTYTMLTSFNGERTNLKKPGRYTAEWYSEGRLLDSHSFRITN